MRIFQHCEEKKAGGKAQDLVPPPTFFSQNQKNIQRYLYKRKKLCYNNSRMPYARNSDTALCLYASRNCGSADTISGSPAES